MKAALLHVLGGSQWQCATVRLAKSMGYRVLVTDYYQERPAYAIADCHEVVDITDSKSTLAVAERYRIDGVVCDTTDVGVPTAAYVADQLNLPGIGHEVALNFTHKSRMRCLTAEARLKSPPFKLVRNSDDLIHFALDMGLPVIVKPVDNQSGKGISVVTKQDELLGAFQHAKAQSRKSEILVESFLAGEEIVVDGFALDGEVNVLGIARKTPNPLNPTVATRITYGATIPSSVVEKIESVNFRALAALGLQSGIFHAEYLLSDEDVIPIDIAARGGGCMIYTHVLPFISGVDANRAMIELAMGDKPRIRRSCRKAANIEFFCAPEGTIAAINGHDEAVRQSNVLGLHLDLGVGDRVGPLQKKDDRLGFVVTGGDNADTALTACQTAKSYLQVRMQGDDLFRPII